MKRIIVVGGGTAGLATAHRLLALSSKVSVAVVEPSKTHYYQPLFTLVGGGVFPIDASHRTTRELISEPIQWVQGVCEGFHPDENKVLVKRDTGVEEKLEYDALVVATGIHIDWGKIKGLEDAIGQGNVSTNYDPRYAPYTWKVIQDFKGGNALFTFPSGPVKCAGAPQKIMYLAEAHWRKSGVRADTNIKYMTAIGKVFGCDHYGQALSKLCDEKNIERRFGRDLIEVIPSEKKAIFTVNPDLAKDTTESEEILQYDMMHVTPRLAPSKVVKESPLADAAGFVEVNKETLQHVRFPNVFALGDCSSLPTSKTAAAITSQHSILVDHLLNHLNGEPLPRVYDGYTSCPLPVGDNKLMLAEFDYNLQPKETFPYDQRVPSSFAYFLKKDVFPLMYWNGLLKGKWTGPGKFRELFNWRK